MTTPSFFGKGLPRGRGSGGGRFSRFASFVLGLGIPVGATVIHLSPAISEDDSSARIKYRIILLCSFMGTQVFGQPE